MYVNGKPVSDYGARLQAGYTVSGSHVSTTYYQARDGTAITVLGTDIGVKKITLPMTITAITPESCVQNKSQLEALMLGKAELTLPDGFCYTAVLSGIGETTQIVPGKVDCTYTFEGIQHEPLQEIRTDGELYARGTMPHMDCILTVTVGKAAASYTVAGVTFFNVAAGDVLVLDGITKRVLINGAPGAQRCDIVEFPGFAPGRNRITCPDPVTVQYYPTYI